eukprot:scaffold343_cov245-Pinguiococcus_pyrenoidosus.AAC.35
MSTLSAWSIRPPSAPRGPLMSFSASIVSKRCCASRICSRVAAVSDCQWLCKDGSRRAGPFTPHLIYCFCDGRGVQRLYSYGGNAQGVLRVLLPKNPSGDQNSYRHR